MGEAVATVADYDEADRSYFEQKELAYLFLRATNFAKRAKALFHGNYFF